MKIPSDNRWTQTNDGDIFGVLNETRNITIDNTGKLKLNRRPFAHLSSATEADFGDVQSIVYYNGAYVIITDDEAFTYNNSSNAVTEIASTPALDSDGDALVFNDLLYVMGATQLAHWDGSSWTTSILASALTNGNPHPMAVFDSNPTYKLAIADGNQVFTYDTSHNINSNVLTLPSQFEISTMEYRNGYLYIGTQNTSGGEARVFIWSGDGANAQYEVPMGGGWVLSMTTYGSTVACVVDSGELALIKGSTKETLAGFPVFYDSTKRWSSTTARRVANRGMTTVRDTIYINIDSDVVGKAAPGMKSGLWAYNPSAGLYHTAAFSTDEAVTDTGLTQSSGTLTTSANHRLVTGDSVMFITTQGLTGVDTGVEYYVSVISDNEIKLALSRKSLLDGNLLEIGGTPTSLDRLQYVPNTDFGKEEITQVGAVGRITSQDPLRANQTADVFFAGRTNDPSGASQHVLCGITDSYNVGSLVTQRIYSDNITQTWKEVYAFIDNLDSSVSEVVIKHRTEKEQSKPTMNLSGVWNSTTTIHSDATKFDECDWSTLTEGDEVFVTSGQGQGRTAHITSIKKTTNTYVVTVDEALGAEGVLCTFTADNWRKTGVITKDRKERDFAKTGLAPVGKGSWIQVKMELRGSETKISHLNIINSVDESAV